MPYDPETDVVCRVVGEPPAVIKVNGVCYRLNGLLSESSSTPVQVVPDSVFETCEQCGYSSSPDVSLASSLSSASSPQTSSDTSCTESSCSLAESYMVSWTGSITYLNSANTGTCEQVTINTDVPVGSKYTRLDRLAVPNVMYTYLGGPKSEDAELTSLKWLVPCDEKTGPGTPHYASPPYADLRVDDMQQVRPDETNPCTWYWLITIQTYALLFPEAGHIESIVRTPPSVCPPSVVAVSLESVSGDGFTEILAYDLVINIQPL